MSPISTQYSAVQLLFLPRVGVSDAGVYICEFTVSDTAKNPYVIPQNGSMSVTLTVTIPGPNITGSDVSVVLGSLAVLTCGVFNNPSGTTVTYQWNRDVLLVATTAMYQVSSSVHTSDAGVYICEATTSDSTNNTHIISGTGSVNVILSVIIRDPVISRYPSQPSYYPGANVTLRCMIEALDEDEKIDYRWTFASELQQQTGTNLPLVPHPTDDGIYTCYANTDSNFTIESQGVNTTLKVLPISMEVQVTSNMNMVLDVAPYNNHTLNCTVSHESFANISATLMFQFISKRGLLHSESMNILTPGPFTTSNTVLEGEGGLSNHICNVTLSVGEMRMVNSTKNTTTVEVIGPQPPAVPMISNVISSTTSATISWTVPKVAYTPENYTVYYYATHESCQSSGSSSEGFNSSIGTYTPNNKTLKEFFFEENMEFSVEIIGLMPSTIYCCFVEAKNTNGTEMSAMTSFETNANVPVLLIIAVSAGALTALTISLLLLICCCACYKRRFKKYQVKVKGGLKDSKNGAESNEGLELKLVGNESKFQIFNYPTGEVISVTDFPDYVKRKGKECIEQEYEELQNYDYKSHDESLLDENRPKDRYQNIYPFDENRVTLKRLPGDDSSDYINASFVDNLEQGRAYIAAQGPLPHTVDDFWRMVWEYELSAIVMLTQLEESGKDKCACYWPEDGTDIKYLDNDLEVKLVKQTVAPLFITRKFILSKIKDPTSSPLSVTHYQFTAWPDHGVPDDKTCITTFASFIRKAHPPSGPPLLVHCSAGVGRTGTFIVLDAMLQRMKKDKTIDIQGYVNQIRSNRMKMVQTAMQYVYIHESLAEYLVCGDTSFAVMNARIEIHKLGGVEDHKTGFQKQFELLQELELAPFDPSMTDGKANPEKNRYTYNLPYDLNRVRLRALNNDYINASWISGYKHRGMFLATQAPLEGTVEDFWRMVWENQSHAIVMLCLTEEGEDECERTQVSYQYWPTEVDTKARFGAYEVTLISEQSEDEYITRKLTLTKTGSNGSSAVTQYHYLHWPEGGKPKGTASILKMAADLVKTQSSTGNKGITVMCNDGVGRTGAFVCIYSQLERIKTVATADVFQCVKSARLQRAGLVRTLDEFVFCYEVAADYNDDMSLYDNFKYVV